jgi:hypothetical protein
MHQLNARQADELAREIKHLIACGQIDHAYIKINPLLKTKTQFRILDRIGSGISNLPFSEIDTFLAQIAADRLEGGWVIIASALWPYYSLQPDAVLMRCQQFIIQADVWYGADIVAERCTGPALVHDFKIALFRLANWRTNSNRWVRRTIGVASHVWAKRSRGDPTLKKQAGSLLGFLKPMFSEWEMDAVKGIAWGLKTIGRNYPQLMTDWLIEEVLPTHPRYRAHMLHKASLYLNNKQRGQISGRVK